MPAAPVLAITEFDPLPPLLLLLAQVVNAATCPPRAPQRTSIVPVQGTTLPPPDNSRVTYQDLNTIYNWDLNPTRAAGQAFTSDFWSVVCKSFGQTALDGKRCAGPGTPAYPGGIGEVHVRYECSKKVFWVLAYVYSGFAFDTTPGNQFATNNCTGSCNAGSNKFIQMGFWLSHSAVGCAVFDSAQHTAHCTLHTVHCTLHTLCLSTQHTAHCTGVGSAESDSLVPAWVDITRVRACLACTEQLEALLLPCGVLCSLKAPWTTPTAQHAPVKAETHCAARMCGPSWTKAHSPSRLAGWARQASPTPRLHPSATTCSLHTSTGVHQALPPAGPEQGSQTTPFALIARVSAGPPVALTGCKSTPITVARGASRHTQP